MERDKVAKLKKQRKKRSCQHIVEIPPIYLTQEEKNLLEILGKKNGLIHATTVRHILIEKDLYSRSYTKSEPANRFEMSSFGELAQMNTHHVRRWPDFGRIYLIMVIDDFSRIILAGRFFSSDSTYNNMLVLKEAIRKYGLFQMLYTDNTSIFNYTLHKYNMVAFTVELRIHPMRKIRTWHNNKFVQEFKYKRKSQF